MKVFQNPSRKEWNDIIKRPVFDPSALESKVLPIMEDVRDNGDKALLKYTEMFDGVKLDSLLVSHDEFLEAQKLVSSELKEAIDLARINIEKFHLAQIDEPKLITTTEGVVCWRESRPISKVGLYIPGGTAPLFSTILMLGIPAIIAGCKEIVFCTPPNKEGKVHPAILYTAHALGIENVYKIGGSQAIAALTYGTETVPKVYKIFGPGNQYVTCAKQLATKFGVAIDMPAGPSEVQVLADDTAVPAFIASDLLSQAEHGVDSQVLLVTNSTSIAEETLAEVKKQLAVLPRKEMAAKALENSRIVVLDKLSDMIDLTNLYGPEHLIVQIRNHRNIIAQVENAGSVFLGNYTPESAGDYASGTNHTLPTNGYAYAYSGVSLDSFIKKITFQEISKEGLERIGPAIEIMAEAEELFAHKNAVSLRLKS